MGNKTERHSFSLLWNLCIVQRILLSQLRDSIFNQRKRMATTNPITNDPIQTKPYSSSYSDGWERAFCKKPQEWLQIIHGDSIKMLDPDGFRENDGVSWETPMTKKEFEKRFVHCTIIGYNLMDNPNHSILCKTK